MRSITKWAIAAAVLFIIGLTLNYFREPLLGYRERLVGDNFAFNMAFFIPLMSASFLISFIVSVDLLLNWNKFQSIKTKAIVLILTTPIMFLFIFQLIRVSTTY